MDFTAVTAANRPQVNRFIRERWFSTDMILRGAIVDMTKADGILTLDDGQILEENTPREHKTQKEGVPQRHKAVSEHPLSAYPFAQNCYEFI